jgi:hypothetical protein
MVRLLEAGVQEAKKAELKRLITSRRFESLETLEDAVDACLWGDEESSVPDDATQQAPLGTSS